MASASAITSSDGRGAIGAVTAHYGPRAIERRFAELRDRGGAVAVAMWANDLERMRLPEGALADGAQVIVAGGLLVLASSILEGVDGEIARLRIRASAAGSQPATSSSEASHASTSMSGGGVGASTYSAGGMRTPATSPTKAVPVGSCR